MSRDPVYAARSRLAVATRRRDTPAADEARRDLHAAMLERRIRATLAASPPISADQRAQLAQLLRGGETA